ncbi:MAG: 50S ribosomal protein L6 [Candidatus Pacebacteria bacterium]|nr:50S ribosomal protein L6 [Candidatus Paceibacterota bacterium]
MSRIGKQPIKLDDRVKVNIQGKDVTVEGPKGKLSFCLPECVDADVADGVLSVSCSTYEKEAGDRAMFGMARSMLSNLVIGVTDGFKRELEIQGVGYRGQCSGNKLTLNLGFSNPVEYSVPDGVDVSMPDNTHIVLESINKQLVGQAAATIRRFRPPDAYKGKGIRYAGEYVSLKEGKTIG